MCWMCRRKNPNCNFNACDKGGHSGFVKAVAAAIVSVVLCLKSSYDDGVGTVQNPNQAKMTEEQMENSTLPALCAVEEVKLPRIVSIREASELMNLPPYYIRKLCKSVPGLAFQSGIKWYINLGRLADYYNGSLQVK